MTTIPTVTLNDGVLMPQVGFGVFQVPDDEAQRAVEAALEAGYRSIDTAMIYGNEAGVGRALAASGVPREELFVTTKLWVADLGAGRARPALDASLDRLGLDHVDLYLIHWPAPETDAYLDTWRELQGLRGAGTRSIGVSNFLPEHLDRVAALGGILPSVNQIELHPALQNRATTAANRRLGIATEAWSPLAQGAALDSPAVTTAAVRHGVTPAQVVLRWHLQHGTVVIPKSVTPSRIAANLDLFGFTLDDAEIAAIDALEADGRTGPHPAAFNG
ncbi:aldo/keto reductase [Tsukamurella tyrosinosolvens]|uniref:aldo/keto reductase n=1 Tax=Tsukamurella tyrosinosolvens TaxID=57704 RepID=UPI0007945C94|nr:aldo/keto reductase [Tsukamurella tyrosinosolvens]KXP04585.1 2,5-diketo-D-gluconic acid reductase [Tsukamurella tyrosinosolvens]KZL97837.1 2,5-diketo-D-gluconic acid reductase [Tsukamurella tyrosinosolvens]MCA4995532.1 aldo/keto reductase [Tsukamurella tyrosinosolvens]QRY84026.1 aldo/keto reductase [Tsukamurella tyrosinosolvens]